MQWEILIVSIQIGGIGIRKSLVESNRSLDGLVLWIKYFGYITLEFVSLRLYVFNSEADDSTANLDSHGVLCLQSELVLQEYNGTEFRSVIFDVKTILFTLDDCMASTDTNVVDTYLTLMTPSKFEFWLFWCHR